jgi:hypothetical protein
LWLESIAALIFIAGPLVQPLRVARVLAAVFTVVRLGTVASATTGHRWVPLVAAATTGRSVATTARCSAATTVEHQGLLLGQL